MKKVKKWLKAKWRFLKGKKRNIGILILLAVKVISVFFPEALGTEKELLIREIVDWVLLGGVADNVTRSESTKKYINKQTNNIKSNLNKMKGIKK